MDITNEELNKHIANKDFPVEIFGEDPNKDYLRFDKKEMSRIRSDYNNTEILTDSEQSIISDFKQSINDDLKDAKIISIETHLLDDYYQKPNADERGDIEQHFISAETTVTIETQGKQFNLYYEGANIHSETLPVGCSAELIDHLKETRNFGDIDKPRIDYASAAIDAATSLFVEQAQENHNKELGIDKPDAVAGSYVVSQSELDDVDVEIMRKAASTRSSGKQEDDLGKAADDFFAEVENDTLGVPDAQSVSSVSQEQEITSALSR